MEREVTVRTGMRAQLRDDVVVYDLTTDTALARLPLTGDSATARDTFLGSAEAIADPVVYRGRRHGAQGGVVVARHGVGAVLTG